MADTGSITLKKLRQCHGNVTLPGSKSIANRALLMAALCGAGQSTVLTNVLRSDDTQRMLEALGDLGVTVTIAEHDPTHITVSGCEGKWPQHPAALDLGNAGTAMRPLLAVLSATLQGNRCILTGDARMQERPIAALIESLRAGGAHIDCLQQEGYPPLEISGGLTSGMIEIDGTESSQYISALLMALPLLETDSVLKLTGTVVSWPYIELTLSMLERFGIVVHQICRQEFMIPGQQVYQSPGVYWVEGDASAASYWLAAGALGGGPLTVHGVGRHSIQGDVKFADYLAQMGAQVTIEEHSITVKKGVLRALDADLNAIPDAAMTFATLALFAQGTTHIRNIANWRIKETDRLQAMAAELRKVGAHVVETEEAISITPPAHLQHGIIDTYNDHRMAMSFALLGFSEVGVTILDPNCCRKTYPNFFTEFCQITQSS
ncbi:3-phosphoshikimate 1-carboxyvinyltransferase [Pseudidiomarina gelatinasegens]|uniref:3-phosphoshikimate 1-carboxyvinyltransferase n=1 Tax=Pseudidiomarina gelatinasegens TaxID=2487740 RepID=A0A443Z5P3_9GAMM|nr:3-phosphoshikimate 1-carboxyvinyltransferase [Pseudidiomarina gelatinasegens]RWU12083.1 3-phosphoshikimate 1-carboxyvinyltransferase [Pseudidiomarina gelatinasegens]|tara:strand:+ start:2255 stop:3559 length:1305 start_codon:yes stop_codon:yes gene_type:complete